MCSPQPVDDVMDMFPLKRDVYSLQIENIYLKETKETYSHSKETYIPPKETYISTQITLLWRHPQELVRAQIQQAQRTNAGYG